MQGMSEGSFSGRYKSERWSSLRHGLNPGSPGLKDGSELCSSNFNVCPEILGDTGKEDPRF